MTELLLTLISAALINNLVLHWPLGVDPVLGSERPQVHALGIATTCLACLRNPRSPSTRSRASVASSTYRCRTIFRSTTGRCRINHDERMRRNRACVVAPMRGAKLR